MRRTLAFLAIALSMFAHADTNALEQARAAYLAARDAYMEERKAAGITNAAPRRAATGTTGTTATILTKSQKRFFENRRICISRDTTTIPGSVITTWYRNGKLDTKGPSVVTNVLRAVQGVAQDNPLEALAERYRVAASDATRRLAKVTEDYMSVSNKAARLDALKTWLEERRDKAPLQTTKAIYQAIIDRLEENQ